MPLILCVLLAEFQNIHKELRIYDKVSHPHILKPLGIHLAVDNVLLMPLRKYNLAEWFDDYSEVTDVPRLTQFCIQIADGLRYLHSKNIIHCDLKIDNILVQDEKGENVEISDFGSALDLSYSSNCGFSVGVSLSLTKRSLEF